MLAAHGFALHDRQTTLFGRVGAPQPDPDFAKKELFHEIDDRPGYYVGAQARYLDRAVLNVLHYDNRADPTAEAPEIRDFAWLTKFDAAALRIETGDGWTVILQALDGDTSSRPGFWLDWEFDSQSALARQAHGRAHARGALRRVQRAVPTAIRWNPAAKTATPGRWRIPTIPASTGDSHSSGCASRATCRRAWNCSVSRRSPRESKLEFSARYSLSGSF